MTTRTFLFAAAAVVAVLGMQIGMQSPAHALTMTECSAKYKDAKTAGTQRRDLERFPQIAVRYGCARRPAQGGDCRRQRYGCRERGVPDGRRFKIFE